ncbi:hypothetical protein F8388_005240, partial [Cannabis sativa]
MYAYNKKRNLTLRWNNSIVYWTQGVVVLKLRDELLLLISVNLFQFVVCPCQNFELVDANDSRKWCKRKVVISDCPGNIRREEWFPIETSNSRRKGKSKSKSGVLFQAFVVFSLSGRRDEEEEEKNVVC